MAREPPRTALLHDAVMNVVVINDVTVCVMVNIAKDIAGALDCRMVLSVVVAWGGESGFLGCDDKLGLEMVD